MDVVQVIVVNDGSDDDTSAIAHEYQRHYPHYFQIIDKENGNYGSCMNAALPLADGKYFRTLDADDWFDSEALILFVEQLKLLDADMVLTEKDDRFLHSGTTTAYRFDEGVICNQVLGVDNVDWENKSLRDMMGVMFITYKTSLLRNTRMTWEERIPFTDFQYCIQPLQAVRTVCFLPIPLYQYQLEREGQSISLPRSSAHRSAFASVSRAVITDYLKWRTHVSQSALRLVRLKMDLLLPNLYRYLYLDGLPIDDSLSQVENLVKEDPMLRQLTAGFDEFRGLKYVAAYRRHPILLQLIHWDYRFRSCLHKIFKR